MAIGDQGTNNYGRSNSSNKKLFEYSYYSRTKSKSEANKNAINITYNAGLMKINIDEAVGDFKYETKATANLSQTKAVLLVGQMNLFEQYIENEKKIDPNKGFGVVCGMGEKTTFIGFRSNTNKDIILFIGKFDNNGVILEMANYTFPKDYDFAVQWTDVDSNKLEKVYENKVEYNMIKTSISDFGHYMNGALAYSVLDTARWDYARLLNKLNPIYDALDIERISYSNQNRSNSFLDNMGSRNEESMMDALSGDFDIE